MAQHLDLIATGFTRELLMQAGWPRPWLSDLLINRPTSIFYCSTCDDMVEIQPTRSFKPPPAWRSDIFRWRR